MSGNFRVLLVAPDIRPDIHVHLGSVFEGLGYLSAFLKREGHEVDFFGPKTEEEAESLEEVVRSREPHLVGFSCVSSMFKYVNAWSARVKAVASETPVICGGIHPTIAPEEVITSPGIDMICRGEGEHSLLEVVGRLQAGRDIEGVRGVWFKRNGDVVRNEPNRPHGFDGFPFPDLDLFTIENTFYYRNHFAALKLSRGCPYGCTYCCNRSVRDCYDKSSKYVRFRSPEDAIDYVKEYLRRYPRIETIAFLDDILCLKMDWFREFASRYRREVGLPFACRGRANLFGEESAALLKEANCYEITFGVESGNDHIRNDVLKRAMGSAQIVEAFRLARKYGITTRANNMIGLPFETVATVFDTIRLNAQLHYKTALTMVFFPFKGSPLYDLCRKEGLIEEAETPDSPYHEESILKLPGITLPQITYFRRWFSTLVRLFQRSPSLGRVLERAHRSGYYPYRPLIWLHRAFTGLQKVGYRLKIRLGMTIKRYRTR